MRQLVDQTIALTILDQLGGRRRLEMMVNAREFVLGADSLSFRFSGSEAANYCTVTYDYPRDLYEMRLYLISPPNPPALVYDEAGLHDDLLIPTFEEETNLFLTLGAIR